MRPSLILLLLAFGFQSCRTLEQHLIVGLLERYVAAQEALAGDDYEKARQMLGTLVEESDGDIKSRAGRAATSPDIGEMRQSFAALSEMFEDMDLPEGYVRAICPHGYDGNDAMWVQRGDQINNPYHGAASPDCGSVKKQADGSEEGK